MCQVPAAEGCLRFGDWDGARDVAPRSMAVPQITEEANFVMSLWEELRSPLATGERLALVRLRCAVSGLSGDDALAEVWQRVALVDSVVQGYIAKAGA